MASVEAYTFENAREFLEFLRLANDRWWPDGTPSQQFVFRGHANADWPLLASGHRPLDQGNRLAPLIKKIREHLADGRLSWADGAQTEPHIVQFNIWKLAQQEALVQFAQVCRRIGLVVQPAPYASIFSRSTLHPGLSGGDEELTYIAQHHGVPTGLLDWTDDPVTAAFFATADAGETDACVWALRELRTSMRASVDIGHQNAVLQMSRPNIFNAAYMTAQRGLFTSIQGDEELYLTSGHWPDLLTFNQHLETNVLTKMTLRRGEVPVLRELLYREGYSKAHLMPSFDNAATVAIELFSAT